MLVAIALSGTLSAQAQDEEPIAYIGHGAFFDKEGKQIVPTPEFVALAQNWYRDKLVSRLNADQAKEFAQLERNTEVFNANGQANLVVRQSTLDWLAKATLKADADGRMLGKLNALKGALQFKLPEQADLKLLHEREEFVLDSTLAEKLLPAETKYGSVKVLSATTNQGQDYIDECVAAGAPIPPPIGQLDPAGLAGWKTQGFIPTAQQFIVGTPAEVRTFQSFAPEGLCIALPRYTNSFKTTVALDGVICLGKTSSKVCIWDNQMSGVTFSFPTATQIPIGVPNLAINAAGQYQAGGFELNGGQGGVCTDCHAGENPYIIHPDAMLTGSLAMGDLGFAPLNLPMFAVNRYDPLAPPAWPQNQLSMSQPLVPNVCGGCHTAGGSGGRFPHLSSELPSYCNTILTQAINETMPPFAPGSEAANPDVIAFKAWCNSAPSAGPSNRGDPHITTTNGINYDFQAGGEFTALRNSDTGFELQTRQTPVATTFTPGPNAYTGLASCVSLNTAAAVRLGKHRISYQPSSEGRMTLAIDGKAVTLPKGGINFGDGNKIANAAAGGGVEATAADGTRVIITPNYWTSQGYWYLNVEVLNTPAREGTMGHIMAGNWLPFAPDGSSFGPAPGSLFDRHVLLNQKFADAWRVDAATSLFDYVPGTSTADFTDRAWPPAPGKACKPTNPTHPPVEPIDPEIARKLCSVIKDKFVFEQCVFDTTIMGDQAVPNAYLLTVKLRGGL